MTYLVIQSFSALTSTFEYKEARRHYSTGVHLQGDIVDSYDGLCNFANEDMILYGVPMRAIRRVRGDG